MTRPKPGMPSPWTNLPAPPLRLPKKFHEELRTVAKLLDSGAIDPADILKLLNPKPSEAPTYKGIQGQIELLTQSIVTAEGWDLTAAEVGSLVATLEKSAKELDRIFAEKAKIEVMAIATKKTRKRNTKTQD